MKKFVCLFAFLAIVSNICWAQLSAFPGAEGFGANTLGGRNGKVVKVTNLDDHGPGSLRAALEAENPRIIIFTVGGIINLETKIRIHNPYVTVAGQTAPGDGICLRGEGIRIYTHDIIIRYLRIRPGDINFGPTNNWGGIDAITIANDPGSTDVPYNIIIDHCSLSWSVDEVVDMWFDTHDVTIQNCIIGEALYKSKHPKGIHSMGMLIGYKATNISVHHNLFFGNNQRNPMINGESLVDFRNNLIYNFGKNASHVYVDPWYIPKSIRINYVNNFIKKGPDSEDVHSLSIHERAEDHTQIYISGNKGPFANSTNSDNWKMVTVEQINGRTLYMLESYRTDQEFSHPFVTTQNAEDAYTYILEKAGATLPRRDPVDKKMINDTKNGKGTFVNSKDHVLSWPSYRKGTPAKDGDGDGMPDSWEKQHGLNSNDAADQNLDYDNDGYTNIEEYINNTGSVNHNARTLNFADDLPYPEMNPLVLQLKQNFPNPFVDHTTLSFATDTYSYVVLKLVDIEGKEYETFISDYLYEGEYEVTMDRLTIKPGIYYFILMSDNQIKGIKAIRK